MTGRRLPNADLVIVPESKITGYLLSEIHPDGRGKARFFASFGFTSSNRGTLADALRSHAAEHRVSEEAETDFGIRYVVEGILRTPDGREPTVRVVWFIGRGEEVPRLVTAYPVKRSEQHDPGA